VNPEFNPHELARIAVPEELFTRIPSDKVDARTK
jgi:hypothetical protein